MSTRNADIDGAEGYVSRPINAKRVAGTMACASR
jgi:hypothetical protein